MPFVVKLDWCTPVMMFQNDWDRGEVVTDVLVASFFHENHQSQIPATR